MKPGRRRFLAGGALAAGGVLAVAGWWNSRSDPALPLERGTAFGAWLGVLPDGRVQVALPNQEMGQGIDALVARLVAEELDLDPFAVQVVPAPLEPVYANLTLLMDGLPWEPGEDMAWTQGARWGAERLVRALGVQATGGSTSTRNLWRPVREAAAAARARLLAEAARRLDAPVDTFVVADGVVTAPSGRRAAYAELAEAAGRLAQPMSTPKPPSDWRLIGSERPSLDITTKTRGTAGYAIDVRLPGLRFAVVRHAPVVGARLVTASLPLGAEEGLSLVTDADWVAVVGSTTWHALQALDAMDAQERLVWRDGDTTLDDAALLQLREAALRAATGEALPPPGVVLREVEAGASDPQSVEGPVTLSARYELPYLAHATMEPPNCTVHLHDGGCEVWAGNQAPSLLLRLCTAETGLPADRCTVHTLPMGGGFGRKADLDFARQALRVARAVGGGPVQLLWPREQDIRHDVFRPAVSARIDAVLGEDGRLRAWRHAIAGPSVTGAFMARIHHRLDAGLPDRTNAEGAVHVPGLPAARRVVHAQTPSPVRVGYWRGVGHVPNAFAVQACLDECAQAAGADPLAWRLAQLGDATPQARRHARVLRALGGFSGWADPLPAAPAGWRLGRGLAIAESFRSVVGAVLELAVNEQGAVRLLRAWCSVDCGVAVDPVNVRAQVAGGFLFGLNAALHGRITLEGGRVLQSNFHDLPVLAPGAMPAVQVDILPGEGSPAGVGEIGVPPAAPALVNALHAATGRRVRRLPVLDAATGRLSNGD